MEDFKTKTQLEFDALRVAWDNFVDEVYKLLKIKEIVEWLNKKIKK